MTKGIINAHLYAQWLTLSPSITAYLGMILAYWFLSFIGLFSHEVAIIMGQLVLMLSPLALFASEKEGGFAEVMLIFPQGREIAVLSRYIFSIALVVFSTLATLISCIFAQTIFQTEIFSWILALLLATLVGFIFLDISLPLLYFYGAEKGKPWVFLFILMPVALGVLFLPSFDLVLQDILLKRDKISLFVILLGGTVIAILGMAPSYFKSQKIYQRKYIRI